MLRFLVMLGITYGMFFSLHWTQSFERVTIFTKDSCLPGFTGDSRPGDGGCIYRDVSLGTSLLTQRYILKSGNIEAFLPEDEITTMAFSADAPRSETWLTWTVLAGGILLILVLLATDPDVWRLVRKLR